MVDEIVEVRQAGMEHAPLRLAETTLERSFSERGREESAEQEAGGTAPVLERDVVVRAFEPRREPHGERKPQETHGPRGTSISLI